MTADNMKIVCESLGKIKTPTPEEVQRWGEHMLEGKFLRTQGRRFMEKLSSHFLMFLITNLLFDMENLEDFVFCGHIGHEISECYSFEELIEKNKDERA